MAAKIDVRYRGAQNYLEVRASPRWGGNWEEGLGMYRRGRFLEFGDPNLLSVAEQIALCDPNSWVDLVSCSVEDILGPPSYGSSMDQAGEKACDALSLFGYECPVPYASVESDHVFPWSLGGMTHPSNHRFLCRFHNRMKGCDIHFFPWDEPAPPWVDEVLSAVALNLRST